MRLQSLAADSASRYFGSSYPPLPASLLPSARIVRGFEVMNHNVWLRLVVAGFACLAASGTAGAQVVEFNRDIRSILSDNCFACHGPDKNQRKAELRLDSEEGAFADRGDAKVLVPGKPEQSELVRRITNTDE